MVSVAIAYFSGSGHTHLMAQAVAEGVQKVEGAAPQLLRIASDQIAKGRWNNETMLNTLTPAGAIVFGSPTYMGGVAAQFKAFIDGASGV